MARSRSATGQPAVLACDELRKLRQRRERHEHRHQVPRLMELAERLAIERAQLCLVDDVEADERMDRSVVEGHLKAEGFEQVIRQQRVIEGATLAIAFV